MDLARQIGSLAGQVAETGFRAVVVEYEGEAAELNHRPMTAALLEGLLAPIVDSINIVNAPIVARERGIPVTETKHARRSDYPSLIRLTVTTERATRTTAGTLFSNRMPRIVELDGIPLEASLGENMLYMVNRDEPGFIGRLGSCLGDAGGERRHLPSRPVGTARERGQPDLGRRDDTARGSRLRPGAPRRGAGAGAHLLEGAGE